MEGEGRRLSPCMPRPATLAGAVRLRDGLQCTCMEGGGGATSRAATVRRRAASIGREGGTQGNMDARAADLSRPPPPSASILRRLASILATAPPTASRQPHRLAMSAPSIHTQAPATSPPMPQGCGPRLRIDAPATSPGTLPPRCAWLAPACAPSMPRRAATPCPQRQGHPIAFTCALRKYRRIMNASDNNSSIPSLATRAAIAAILEADNGLSPKHRARVLAVLDAPDGSPERAAGWIPASIAAAQVGVALSTLVRWIGAGKVHARKTAGERATLVSLAEVSAFAAAHPHGNRQPAAAADGEPPAAPAP